MWVRGAEWKKYCFAADCGITSSAFLHQRGVVTLSCSVGVRETYGVKFNVPIQVSQAICDQKSKLQESRTSWKSYLMHVLQDCQRRWQQVVMDRLEVTVANNPVFVFCSRSLWLLRAAEAEVQTPGGQHLPRGPQSEWLQARHTFRLMKVISVEIEGQYVISEFSGL